ncbi:MAG: FAD-binding protein [Bacteroidetes bacterium]|nr:MAG: FAD-binding protein [Bacteroidota bacterium]TAG90557.1 MAG: FAD-binding protein [Bacteroidota bacterium]
MQQINIITSPDVAFDTESLCQHLQKSYQFTDFRVLRRSIDARQKTIKVNLTIALYQNEVMPDLLSTQFKYQDVSKKQQVIIVGAGPAGLFAALRLIELGIKPIVLERGQDVRARRRDLAAINKEQIVNTESNYCFGEGGAGTYSDGKLYTRSHKRGDMIRVLEILVGHGATEDILIDAHPHIGTNKLPLIVQNIRETIFKYGGEIHFNTKVIDFILEKNKMKGVITADNKSWEAIGVILATGHSARDIFSLLQQKNIDIEFKPFALGVRIEHPQKLIDKIQYHCEERGDYLPASSYSLVSQVNYKNKQRGVFSFCMCPGGFIVPAATENGEIVVNGMSPSRRNSKFANSGIVVAIDEDDIKEFKSFGALAGVAFQQAVEQKSCQLAGNTQKAPAQKMLDFTQKKQSKDLLDCSYQPGLTSVVLDEVLPDFVAHTLREGFIDFGKKMKGYLTNEAQIIGVESRTSSPIRIPRHPKTCEHTQIANFFPCGEGAGYAGGIMSAAMDGEKCAESLVSLLL